MGPNPYSVAKFLVYSLIDLPPYFLYLIYLFIIQI
nr:MAG TPA: hypothetical protein [Caudoviricetes sp.]